jgi:hypothetical protein
MFSCHKKMIIAKNRHAAGATPTQTDARSISTILTDANGRVRIFLGAEMGRPARDALSTAQFVVVRGVNRQLPAKNDNDRTVYHKKYCNKFIITRKQFYTN